MKSLATIDRLDRMLLMLDLTDADGERITEPTLIQRYVADHSDEGRWRLNWDRCRNNEISDDEFLAEATICIGQAMQAKSRKLAERAITAAMKRVTA